MEIKGRGGISAKIIADSLSEQAVRITTYELVYPRFIHAELMTHRAFSRNAASSRAIPVNKVIELVEENTAMPVHWGLNQPGMQAKEENNLPINSHGVTFSREEWWELAAERMVWFAEGYRDSGYHKQIVNRLLETFQFIKVIVTATEYNNWFWLRDHEAAQPEIAELARCMFRAREQNIAFVQELKAGQWHVPYVDFTESLGYTIPVDGDYENGRIDLTLEEALKVSASCCAQVSYRVLDNSVEKAIKIYDMLVNSEPVHASPFEHQATPMTENDSAIDWNETYTHPLGTPMEGITHYDRYGNAWSANFRGWIQHRQLIPNNAQIG